MLHVGATEEEEEEEEEEEKEEEAGRWRKNLFAQNKRGRQRRQFEKHWHGPLHDLDFIGPYSKSGFFGLPKHGSQ
jgi:hypothetical protein